MIKRKTIDLSHPLSSDIPIYPGTPPAHIYHSSSICEDGFQETKLSFTNHTGTHVDVPAHMITGGKKIEDFTVNQFFGNAFLIECKNKQTINSSWLDTKLEKANKPDFILFNTGWHKKWNTKEYFANFPLLSRESISLVTKMNIKGIGIDTPSVDSVDSKEYPNHMILFNSNMIIVENLTNLDLIKSSELDFICLPLNILNADASPTRAIAITEDYV